MLPADTPKKSRGRPNCRQASQLLQSGWASTATRKPAASSSLASSPLRYCARPPFALERLSVTHDASGRATKVRYVLPRHKAANWVGPGRSRTSTRPGANGVVELSPFEFLDRLADLVPPPRKHRHRYHGVFAPNHKLRRAVTALDKRECRQAARDRDRRAWGRRSCHGRMLRRESESVDGGRKRRRGVRVAAVQNGGAQPCRSLGGEDRGDSPDHTPFQREAQECTATWRFGARFAVRC